MPLSSHQRTFICKLPPDAPERQLPEWDLGSVHIEIRCLPVFLLTANMRIPLSDEIRIEQSCDIDRLNCTYHGSHRHSRSQLMNFHASGFKHPLEKKINRVYFLLPDGRMYDSFTKRLGSHLVEPVELGTQNETGRWKNRPLWCRTIG